MAGRLIGGALALAFCAASVSHAQQARFKSGVDLVTVDVAVLNGNGQPITGLTVEDFELTVDGSKRRIAWAEFVPHRSAAPASITTDHFSSNEGLNAGRVVLIAVDQAHIRRVEGQAALRAAAAFVDSLDREDRVAVTSLRQVGTVDFTREHAVAKRHLDGLTGSATPAQVFYTIGLAEALAISEGARLTLDQVVRRECGAPITRLTDPRRLAEREGAADPCPTQVELEARTLAQHARNDARQSINALQTWISRLAQIEGPKTVVLVSEGLVAEPQFFDLSALGAAAHAAHVTIHVLQLESPLLDASDSILSPTANADINLRGDGLVRLAGSARGGMFRLVGADPKPFRRILSEISGYYLLAFEPTDADRASGTRRLDVKARGAAVVRARPSFTIPATAKPETTEAELVRLLRDPRTVTELPVRVATYTYRQPAGEGFKTIVAAETGQDRDVTFGYVIVNRSGVIAASGGDIAGKGRYVATTTLPQGGYMLKAAVIDSAGRRGSVERHFEVRLAKSGKATYGDLMLAEPGPGRGTELAMHPVVAMVRGPELIAYMEVYADDWTPGPGALKLEMVSDGAGGDAVTLLPTAIERTGPGRWTITARAALSAESSGTRFIRATITAPGADPTQVTRVFSVAR
jgi:VWFA-related protein